MGENTTTGVLHLIHNLLMIDDLEQFDTCLLSNINILFPILWLNIPYE